MTLTELYDISESENVPVYSFQMNECESISVLQDGNCFLAIDPMKLQSETEEKKAFPRIGALRHRRIL